MHKPHVPLKPLTRQLAKASKKYHSACAKAYKICVQLWHKLPYSPGITFRFSIGTLPVPYALVAKACEKTLMLSMVTHKLCTIYFRHITDTVRQLSTISTPPITTTTNIFN